MQITIDRLLGDPDLYFHSFDADHARFVSIDRKHLARSMFLDKRIERSDDQIYRIPLDVLQQALSEQGASKPDLHFIHHVAQCGSTLLARALDRPGASLVYREPFHLRQLGAQIGAAGDPSAPRFALWRDLLRFSLQQLSKRYEGETVVVKGNVPTSMIGSAIDAVDPGQTGILLYFPLEDYLAAVLRTPQHGEWVQSISAELRVEQDAAVGTMIEPSVPQKAAALWLVLMRRFHALQQAAPGMASLDANHFFDHPAEAIRAANAHLGTGVPDERIDEAVEGQLFASYAKNPSLPYRPEQRIERREATKRELSESIAEARNWVEARWDASGLPERLANPVSGDAPSLV